MYFKALIIKRIFFLMFWPAYSLKLVVPRMNVDTLLWCLFVAVGVFLAESWSIFIVLPAYLVSYVLGIPAVLRMYDHPAKLRDEDVFAVAVLGGIALGILAHALVGQLFAS